MSLNDKKQKIIKAYVQQLQTQFNFQMYDLTFFETLVSQFYQSFVYLYFNPSLFGKYLHIACLCFSNKIHTKNAFLRIFCVLYALLWVLYPFFVCFMPNNMRILGHRQYWAWGNRLGNFAKFDNEKRHTHTHTKLNILTVMVILMDILQLSMT